MVPFFEPFAKPAFIPLYVLVTAAVLVATVDYLDCGMTLVLHWHFAKKLRGASSYRNLVLLGLD